MCEFSKVSIPGESPKSLSSWRMAVECHMLARVAAICIRSAVQRKTTATDSSLVDREGAIAKIGSESTVLFATNPRGASRFAEVHDDKIPYFLFHVMIRQARRSTLGLLSRKRICRWKVGSFVVDVVNESIYHLLPTRTNVNIGCTKF